MSGRGHPFVHTSARVTGGRMAGEYGYVVRWPDGSSAFFRFQWQATAAANDWQPPPGVARRVWGQVFHYVGRAEAGAAS